MHGRPARHRRAGGRRGRDRSQHRCAGLARRPRRGDGRAARAAGARAHREPAREGARTLRGAAARRAGPARLRARADRAAAGGNLEAPAIVRGSVGDGPELVYYHGHFDVVPAQHASQFEPAAPRREDHRTWNRRHEGRNRLDALRRGGRTRARPARRAQDRHPPRLRRGDRQHGRLRPPARRGADRSRRAGDARRGADGRRHLARVARRHHAARAGRRPRGTCRIRARRA